jgi:Skp family chaperone for outer membrane proteins
MNKSIIKSLLLAGVALLGIASAQAQTTPKIVSVDIGKVADSYWKMKDYRDALQTFSKTLQSDVNKQNDSVNELGKTLTELNEKIGKASEKDKAGLQADYQVKVVEYQAKQEGLRSLYTNGQQKVRDADTNLTNQARQDILQAADAIAKKVKASVLITDRGTVQYYDSFAPVDITADVLAELNKDHPAEKTAAAPATK